MTTFENCTFLACGYIPEKNKGTPINGDSKHFKQCIFLVEKGKPAILWIVRKKTSFIYRLLSIFKNDNKLKSMSKSKLSTWIYNYCTFDGVDHNEF